VTENASFVKGVNIQGSTTLNASLMVSGNTTLMNVNVSSLTVANGFAYNPLLSVYSLPDRTYNYIATDLNSKRILNASYVAPQNGYYRVDACLNLTTNLRCSWRASIESNNPYNVSFNYTSPYVKATYFLQNMNEVVKLDKGNYVEAAIYCGGNVSLTTTQSVFKTTLMTQY
jgi:hypothetical protein